jgi:hypothetical protein
VLSISSNQENQTKVLDSGQDSRAEGERQRERGLTARNPAVNAGSVVRMNGERDLDASRLSKSIRGRRLIVREQRCQGPKHEMRTGMGEYY